jgi:hypothetical protein
MEAAMSTRSMVPTYPPARAKRFRALYDMVRDKEDWTKPVTTTLDEPAIFAYLPEPKRRAAREALVADLQQAVAVFTGEPAKVYVALNGDSVRFHVSAAGFRAVGKAAEVKRMFE